MKQLLLAASLASAACQALAADVGVSVSVGQPGFYGRIDIGSLPPPRVIYAEPVIIHRARPGVAYEPIYLHVPPGHERHWGKHCRRYNACGRPVFFVDDRWYNDVYVVEHQRRHGRRYDDERRSEDRGRGRGHGHGRGRGHDD